MSADRPPRGLPASLLQGKDRRLFRQAARPPLLGCDVDANLEWRSIRPTEIEIVSVWVLYAETTLDPKPLEAARPAGN